MLQKHIKLFARYGGVVAVFFELFALLLFYLHQPSAFNGNLPISYFATLPQTRVMFTLFYVIAALSFWIFAKHHLSRHYRTPLKIFAFSMIGFAAMAITPFDPNNTVSNVLHTIFSMSSFGAFLAGMYVMAKNNLDRQFRYITFAAVVLSGILIVSFRFVPQDSHLIMPLEAGAWFVCQVWMVWVSLVSYRKA